MSTPEALAEGMEILRACTREFIEDAPLAKVHPNPWNPNRQDERTYEATRESLREFGFIDPATVWPHPEIEGEWMVLDGEHRVRAAGEESIENGDLIVLHGLGLDQAQRLTVILNETRGDADVGLMGRLLAGLADRLGGDMEALGRALPYTHYELTHLVEIGRVNWDEFSQQVSGREARGARSNFAVVLDFDEAERERWDTLTGMYLHESEDPELTIERAVLDLLTAAVKA